MSRRFNEERTNGVGFETDTPDGVPNECLRPTSLCTVAVTRGLPYPESDVSAAAARERQPQYSS
jgi:hypothetical protein